MRKTQSLIILLFITIISCEDGLKGDFSENLEPNTSLTLNSINLPEGERLLSQVNISWWGDDPDGFVIGYEFFIGDPLNASEEDWVFTNKSDSIFILPIPQGSNDADVTFSVRAVDNEDLRDSSPSSLVFPITNTEPSIQFIANELPPDTTYRILSFGFIATDPDGDLNLNRIEIALNDTSSENNWVEISVDADFVTLQIDDTLSIPEARIFIGRNLRELDSKFSSVNLNQDNEFFIRSIDNAGSVSEVKSHVWYVKKQESKILFLNDYFGTSSNARAQLHLSVLENIGIDKVDYIDISDGVVSGGTRVALSNAFPDRDLANPTINKMLAEWDYIYWISDDLNRNIGYALELTTQFFEEGGKMFINIPIEFISDQNPIFQFLPFQGVQAPPEERNAEFIVQKCTSIIASEGLGYNPSLRFKANVFPSYPIIPFTESVDLFEAEFRTVLRNPTAIADYDGIKIVSAMNQEQSILYFGFDLNDFTTSSSTCSDSEGNLPPSDLEGLLDYLIIETLGFEQ